MPGGSVAGGPVGGGPVGGGPVPGGTANMKQLREQDAFSPYSRIAYEGQMKLSAAQYSVFNRVTT